MSVEYYKKTLDEHKSNLEKERMAKKRDNERFDELIKNGYTSSDRKYWREKKKEAAENHDRMINMFKELVKSTTLSLDREKKCEKARKQQKNPRKESRVIVEKEKQKTNQTIEEILEEARVQLKNGDESKAVKLFNNALKANCTHASIAYFELFEYYNSKERGFKKAVTYGGAFNKYKHLHPDISKKFEHNFSEMIISRCETLMQQGKRHDALVLFNANLEYIIDSDKSRFVRANKLNNVGEMYM